MKKGSRRFAEYDIRSTSFFVASYSFFFSPLFDALRVRIFFVERQSDANCNCTLVVMFRAVMVVGASFQIFAHKYIFPSALWTVENEALVIDMFHY